MMTEAILNEIIEGAKKQLRYEEVCMEALKVIFPESVAPIVVNPLWSTFATAMDVALGLEDFFGWWIWGTECGIKDNARIWLNEVCYPVRNAREILAYAEAERNFIEDKKSAEDKVCG